MKSDEPGRKSGVSGAEKQPRPPAEKEKKAEPAKSSEIGGPPGPEPTRYGDWQYKGRCTDF